jgi:hypothetical protein
MAFPQVDTPSGGPLTADDFKPVPAGCGQQRWPERRVNWPDTVPTDHAPMPAEACTDIGAESDPYDDTALIRGLMSAIGITAVIAAIVAVAV